MEELKSQKQYIPQQQIDQAMGNINKLHIEDQICLETLKKFSLPLPEPNSGDWLQSQKETGQSFKQYLDKKRNVKMMQTEKVDSKNKFIYIVALEENIDQQFQDKLKVFAEAFFTPMKVKFYSQKQTNIQSKNNNFVKTWKIPQRIHDGIKQYNASNILEKLKLIIPRDAYCIIGIMLTDIYPRPSYNYVFGLASLSQKVGVFSFARYQDSFWDPSLPIDYDQVVYRSCKVMIHELCHQFGMKHCIYYYCLMNGSNSLEEAGRKPYLLCPICIRKLQAALSFDYVQRYKLLNLVASTLQGKSFKQLSFEYQSIIKQIQNQIQQLKYEEQKIAQNNLGKLQNNAQTQNNGQIKKIQYGGQIQSSKNNHNKNNKQQVYNQQKQHTNKNTEKTTVKQFSKVKSKPQVPKFI